MKRAIYLTIAIAVAATFAFADGDKEYKKYKKGFVKRNATLEPLYKKECNSYRTLYPPHLLPAKSLQKLMANLEDHFGDDASLEEPTRSDIEKFLVKNSANNSTKEVSFYILKSLKDSPIAITKTPYWKKRHKNIDKKTFKSSKVKSKANCKACHTDIEKGIIEDENIKLPKV